MAMSLRDRVAYRADDMLDHKLLTDEERREMLMNYLPPPPQPDREMRSKKDGARGSRFGVRRFLKNQLYLLTYYIMHTIFSLYIRLRQAWHMVWYKLQAVFFYHHRTPALIQKDVKGLKKLPTHLSVILTAEEATRRGGDLEGLINETAEIATWCACAGIPMLSVYERTGILKKYMPQIHQITTQKFDSYFGRSHPGLTVVAPHGEIVESSSEGEFEGKALKLLLISYQDGRDSMVDLTRTLTEMSQKAKLSPGDINMDLINAELSEGIMQEPDLLIIFGPHVELAGYPPWQVRLTEIFCLQDNQGVGYQVFMRALRRFSGAQMRRGK